MVSWYPQQILVAGVLLASYSVTTDLLKAVRAANTKTMILHHLQLGTQNAVPIAIVRVHFLPVYIPSLEKNLTVLGCATLLLLADSSVFIARSWPQLLKVL